jgi:murein DD-endopeptidase MepM/ murein hydrolase activator NlpD
MRRLLLVLTAFLSVAAALAAPAEAAWLWPVRGEVITQYRNGSDPYAGGQHRGIDIAAAVGTPVGAAAGGEVRFAGTAGSSGLTVSVRTGDGYDTSYLHLSSIAVRAGERVAGGERLGAVGTTGERSATAPHLHFGVREAGTRYAYVDPLSLLPPTAAPPTPLPAAV